MDRRPRIALTLSLPDTDAHRRARERYIRVLSEAGADVIPLDATEDPLDDFDGLCVSGGEDVVPDNYGDSDNGTSEATSAERDALELGLIAKARERDVPILGICRGFQVLNVAFGGTLVQHLDGHRPLDTNGVVQHTVCPTPGSLLARITTESEQRVNSRHHQAVTPDRLAPGLVATAHVDGLVEAFEAPDHRWVVGIQWHPERTTEVDPAAVRIFQAFVEAAERVPAR